MGYVILLLVLLAFAYLFPSRKSPNTVNPNPPVQEPEIKVGDRITTKRNGYAHIVIRKGMTGVVTEIRNGGDEFVVQFDGFPFESCIPLWILRD